MTNNYEDHRAEDSTYYRSRAARGTRAADVYARYRVKFFTVTFRKRNGGVSRRPEYGRYTREQTANSISDYFILVHVHARKSDRLFVTADRKYVSADFGLEHYYHTDYRQRDNPYYTYREAV